MKFEFQINCEVFQKVCLKYYMGYTYTKRIICCLSAIQISLGVLFVILLNLATLGLRSVGQERWVSDQERVLTPNTERLMRPQRRGYVGGRVAHPSHLPGHTRALPFPPPSLLLAIVPPLSLSQHLSGPVILNSGCSLESPE